MLVLHSPPPESCCPEVCRWPGSPHPGPGLAGSCLASTPAQGSLGVSDSSLAWSSWQSMQSLGEGTEHLSGGSPEEGCEKRSAFCRSRNTTPSLVLGILDDQGSSFTTQTESHASHTMPRNMHMPLDHPQWTRYVWQTRIRFKG